jgi:hypothetical protein
VLSDVLADLVNPVAEVRARQRLFAPRPPLLERPVALVDATMNPRGMWGQGILDMVEQTIRRCTHGVVFERVDRPPAGSPAEIWASTMAARYAALVIAAGD